MPVKAGPTPLQGEDETTSCEKLTPVFGRLSIQRQFSPSPLVVVKVIRLPFDVHGFGLGVRGRGAPCPESGTIIGLNIRSEYIDTANVVVTIL